MPRIRPFQQLDADVRTQLHRDLSVAGVDRDDFLGAVLQHAVGKSASGRANVHTGSSVEINLPMLQRGFQLQAAAADIRQVFTQETNISTFLRTCSGLFHFLSIDKHTSCEHQRLRALARKRQTALHQQLVNADLHCGFTAMGPGKEVYC